METTAANPRVRRGPSTLLIVLLLVLLVGGGIGVFFMLKPKGKDQDQEKNPTDKKPSGASGRQVTDTHFQVPPTILASITNGGGVTAPTPGELGSRPDKPIYYKHPKVLEHIAITASEWQKEGGARMDAIRSLYDIGRPMIETHSDAQQCIYEMFSKLAYIDYTSYPDRRYLAFPIYGTFEPKGKLYRAELKNILDRGWEGLNLTHSRDSSAPWWCREIGLNLLVGTTVSNTPKTDNVWRSWAPRSELDFYKGFNRHWVQDADLADVFINRHNTQQVVWKDHPDARAAYCATGMYEFVEDWVREIDRLDEVTRFSVFKSMRSDKNPDRWYFSYVNPESGKDEKNTSDNPFYFMEGSTDSKGQKMRK
ncbi:hypothetical protein [Aureispira anguillae]|uniref:Uncharacterized protein n=1 Tax=Aureispira anguillae TaxID=2864201 RepID=A0A915YGW8_9BACT|nr:hypothetical protein [Aureispira anguillae]BDS12738.1 hypothetical protein AsAng_0034630 [Aureispira anguillae]